LGKALAGAILHFIPAQEPVLVPIDDTTAQHRGKHVYGKGCHHDAVRSAHKHIVYRWGHRWIVLAMFCYRHRHHATLVSRYHGDANLYAPPPPAPRKKRTGRPRTKGRKLPKPEQLAARRKLVPATVSWYGGLDRKVELTGDTGCWYKAGKGLVPVRWVFVHDVQGTHRDEYFYTTDTSLSLQQITSWFTARWPIETTFQEVRAHLGFETPRQYVAKSVLRTAPCLLGLFSIICLKGF
jgi:hypothetical protein